MITPTAILPPIIVDGTTLTEDERTYFDYCESTIDGIVSQFGGQWFDFKLDTDKASPKVVNALKQTYEAQSFGVGVFPVLDGSGGLGGYQMVFAPPTRHAKPTATRTAAKELPPLNTFPGASAFAARPAFTAPASMTEHAYPRLLVRMPTRNRPAQAISVLSAYRNMAGAPITLEVVIDADDESMMASDVLQRLRALDAVITVGNHKSKIEAVNAGAIKDWDILLLASDDMMPVEDGYAAPVIAAMAEHFPHFDGAVFFDDGYAHDRCCTLPIMGRRLYEQFGYVYEPSYKSLVCDIEQTDVLRALGRLVYVDRKIIEHRHPAAGGTPSDALYKRNNGPERADRETYQRRELIRRPHAQVAFDSPPLWLSICIATVPERRPLLARLLDHVYAQIIRDRPRQVEVVIESGHGTIGEKRQRLLEKAHGHFVAFVDDDDWIAHDYVTQVVGALEREPDTDCASLWGIITENGDNPQKFHHSIKYEGWYRTADGLFARTPNHLNAVRRELALKAGFQASNFGEDHQFSKALRPLLKSEVAVESVLYHYWYRGNK